MGLITCPDCGSAVSDVAPSCPHCGRPNLLPGPVLGPISEPRPMGQDPVMRMLLPVGRSSWAIVAGYFGLFSILIFPAPFALLFGILAVFDINKHPDRHGMGRAVFGIVMGLIGTLIIASIIMAAA